MMNGKAFIGVVATVLLLLVSEILKICNRINIDSPRQLKLL